MVSLDNFIFWGPSVQALEPLWGHFLFKPLADLSCYRVWGVERRGFVGEWWPEHRSWWSLQKWVQVLKKYLLNKSKGRKEKLGRKEIDRGTIVTLTCSIFCWFCRLQEKVTGTYNLRAFWLRLSVRKWRVMTEGRLPCDNSLVQERDVFHQQRMRPKSGALPVVGEECQLCRPVYRDAGGPAALCPLHVILCGPSL